MGSHTSTFHRVTRASRIDPRISNGFVLIGRESGEKGAQSQSQYQSQSQSGENMSATNIGHLQGLKPLQQNNSQTPGLQGRKMAVKKTLTGSKVTARADSTGTGLENDHNQIVKHHHSVKKMQTPSVARRNARERNRVKGVNDGFRFLKKVVPEMKSKSSKVETLRGAINYIKCLRDLLDMEDIDSSKNSNFEVKMESGDDDDDNSTFSELTTEHNSSENSSPETSLRDLPGLHPMVYQLPVTSTFRTNSLLTPITSCPLIVSPEPTMTQLIVHTPPEPTSKHLESPAILSNEPLEKLPSISTTMWWPLPAMQQK